jgi:hypothetical protein
MRTGAGKPVSESRHSLSACLADYRLPFPGRSLSEVCPEPASHVIDVFVMRKVPVADQGLWRRRTGEPMNVVEDCYNKRRVLQ